jgi:hypothetical protein
MLKFRATDDLEAYISDVGCLVLKQNSFIEGKEITIIITPEQAYEVAQMVLDFHEEMCNSWMGGLDKESDDE